MKQPRLRVDDLQRKAERAGRGKRPVRSIVDESLGTTVATYELRARLRAVGMLDEPRPVPADIPTWEEIEELTQGLGRAVSEALEADRHEDW